MRRSIHMGGVLVVGAAEAEGERIGAIGNDDPVHVVEHQAIREEWKGVLTGRGGDQLEVERSASEKSVCWR
jgi:hypothetical protein